MSDISGTVELFPALAWDCPECGKANTYRGIFEKVPSREPEDFEAYEDLEDHEALMEQDYCASRVPEHVRCTNRECKRKYFVTLGQPPIIDNKPSQDFEDE